MLESSLSSCVLFSHHFHYGITIDDDTFHQADRAALVCGPLPRNAFFLNVATNDAKQHFVIKFIDLT